MTHLFMIWEQILTFIFDSRKKFFTNNRDVLDFHESFHFSLLGLGFQIDKQLYKHQKFLKFINYEL